MKDQNLATDFFRLNSAQKLALKKLNIIDLVDMLYHFPVRYGDTSTFSETANIRAKENVVIFGRIKNLSLEKTFKSKMPIAKAKVEDDSGVIDLIWFNQAYIAKMYTEGSLVRVEGVASEDKKGRVYISNPKIEKINKIPIAVGDSLFSNSDAHTLYPVYKESKGVTSNWFYYSLQKVFKSDVFENLEDPIPEEILKKYNLPNLKTAMIWIHNPKKEEDAKIARKRFAFESIFFIQLERQILKNKNKQEKSFSVSVVQKDINDFLSRLDFPITEAQKRVFGEISGDFEKGEPMSRLLEGDVGSGKTVVAALASFLMVKSKPKGQNYGTLQVGYMCPTEILAKQHFESFIKMFSYLGINIGLITSSGARKFPSKTDPKEWTDISKNQLLKWVKNGEVAILVGTHSLIQKKVEFKHLALSIIDEQHRFGVFQRQKIVTKEERKPHLLSMTATPIPRTLSLTMYGDLDLSILDQMPVGRKPIITEVVTNKERDSMYEKIRKELKSGKQAYIICPRIDEADPTKEMAVIAKSVIEEAKRLKQNVFKEFTLAPLHSRMKDTEKEKVMSDFKNKKIDILVATSVVEVGVNVPNATVILIEGAERFGLSQLHQLRGRVIRSNDQAYCYIFTENNTEKTVRRLKAFCTAKNGFELAEYDLKFRGSGELSAGKQWGVSDISMEALQNIKLVEFAQKEAREIVAKDPELNTYPKIRAKIDLEAIYKYHFE